MYSVQYPVCEVYSSGRYVRTDMYGYVMYGYVRTYGVYSNGRYVHTYVRTYVRTRQYGEGGLLSFYKATNYFLLAVTSYVNGCTFYTFSIFTRVLSDVTRSDVLVPTYFGISFSVHLLVLLVPVGI